MDGSGRIPISRRQKRVLPFLRAIFAEIATYVMGSNTFPWAIRFGHKNDSRVRGWKKGRAVPHKWEAALQTMGVTPEIVFWSTEERWLWLAENIKPGQPPPPLKQIIVDPFISGTFDKACGGTEIREGSTVICPIVDPLEFITDSELRAQMKAHVRRGIDYLLIVPGTFTELVILLAAVNSLKSPEDEGSLRVAIVDRPWNCPKAAVIVVRPEVPFTKEHLSKIMIDDVSRASVQLYEKGDETRPRKKIALSGRRNFILISERRIPSLLSKIAGWLASPAEWE